MQAREKELAQKIMHHKRVYYAGKPEISDFEFDRLEDELRALNPNHPALQFVGSDEDLIQNKLVHQEPMLSLEKTYKAEDLVSWKEDEEIVGCYKIDGNSLSLVYKNGSLHQAKTRGNGKIGEQVLEKIFWVDEIPKVIQERSTIEIRGELYCTESSFVSLAKVMMELGLEKPTSPRNIVAGLLGRKNFHNLCQYFSFFAFDFLDLDSETPSYPLQRFQTEIEKLSFIENLGFLMAAPKLIRDQKDLEHHLESVKIKMEEDEIPLDGAVYVFNRLKLHAELGSTSHHPKYKMSFKWQGETAQSRIVDIHWSTSRYGIVTPVAEIEPVYLSGASITNITLHNAEHVKVYNLKVKDQIEVVRSGEVIPKFLRVVESSVGNAELPNLCPSCGSKLLEDGVRIVCDNRLQCPAQISGIILNWMVCCGIEDVSEKRLEQMMQAGFVKRIPDLYDLKKEDLMSLPATKEKMAEKILQRIEASKKPSAVQFLTGLSISGMGANSWEKLLDRYDSWKNIFALSEEEIIAVDGFAEKTAKSVFEGLKATRNLVDELLAKGVCPVDSSRQNSLSGPLSGAILVITGELSVPRKQIEIKIKQAGAKLSSSVSKNTTAVVCNELDSDSSKMKQAKKLGVPVWNEEVLTQKLMGN